MAAKTEPDENLSIPTIDEFIQTPKFVSDDEAPDELQPKRRRSRKREREAIAALKESLIQINAMAALMIPCSCSERIPDDWRDKGAHLWTCARMMTLNESETEALSAAIQAELDAHPELAERLAHSESWLPHLILGTTLFGIVMARRNRAPNMLVDVEGNMYLLEPDTQLHLNGIG